jgi:hypothetical protein
MENIGKLTGKVYTASELKMLRKIYEKKDAEGKTQIK